MESFLASTRFKMSAISGVMLVGAVFLASSGMAGKLGGASVETPVINQNVQDKDVERDLREKVFLHRLSLGSPALASVRS